jgi:hypothetical protein
MRNQRKNRAARIVQGWNGKTKTKRGISRPSGIGKMPAKVDADRAILPRL